MVLTSAQGQELLRRREHPDAGAVEPPVEGELLQVHQRDPQRHRGRHRELRPDLDRGGQRHRGRRRLRAGAGLRADPADRRQLLGRRRCPRCRCSACCPAPAGSPASSTSAGCARTAPTCSPPRPRASRGKQAVEWKLVDEVIPKRQWDETVAERAAEAAARSSPAQRTRAGIALPPLERTETADGIKYQPRRGAAFDRDAGPRRDHRVRARGRRARHRRAGARAGRRLLAAGHDPRARRPDPAAARQRAGAGHLGHPHQGRRRGRAGVRAGDRRAQRRRLAGQRDPALLQAGAQAPRRDVPQPDRADRARLLLRRRAAGAGAGLRPPVHARRLHGGRGRRGGRAGADRAVGVQLRHVPDAQRAVPAGVALLAATRTTVAKLRQETGRRIEAVEALELGLVTDAPDDIDWEDEVRIMLEERASLSPGRADRHGGQPPLRRPGDDGVADLLPAHRLAELDLRSPQRLRAGGCTAPLRHGPQGRLRPRSGSSDEQHVDRLLARRSRTTSTWPATGSCSARWSRWQPNFLNWWKTMGPAVPDRGRLPAHRRRRRPRGLGALRPRRHGGVPLGRVPRRAQLRPADRVRRAEGRAGLAAGARRVPRRPAAADRHPGRHRAGLGRAAAPPRRDRAQPLRPAQPVPGQRRGGPPPLGDGLPAARLLRPQRPRGGRGAAAAQLRRPRQPAHPRRVQRGDARTGCRSSCSPTSPTGTASTSSAR